MVSLKPGYLTADKPEMFQRLGRIVEIVRCHQRSVGTLYVLRHVEGNRVVSVEALDPQGVSHSIAADYIFSTMPVRELIHSLDVPVPAEVRAIADGLNLDRKQTILSAFFAIEQAGAPATAS